MKIKSIAIFVLLGIIGSLAIIYFFPSDEKKVKRQFALLAQWVSKDHDEKPLAMGQRVKKIGSVFAEKCNLQVSSHSISGTFSREEIIAFAARGRLNFSQFNIKFYDLTVTFPEERKAQVALTGRLNGKAQSGETVDETRELICVLKKVENEWLFSEFEVVEVLKK